MNEVPVIARDSSLSLPISRTFDLSFIGFLPALIACAALFLATRAKEALVEENFYPASVAIYPLDSRLHLSHSFGIGHI